MAVHCCKGVWQTKGSRKSKICVRICAGKLEPHEYRLSHCSSGKIRNIPHYTAKRQAEVMRVSWEQKVHSD